MEGEFFDDFTYATADNYGYNIIDERGAVLEALARVTNRVRLKYAAMNLKKLAVWSWYKPYFDRFLLSFVSLKLKSVVFTG